MHPAAAPTPPAGSACAAASRHPRASYGARRAARTWLRLRSFCARAARTQAAPDDTSDSSRSSRSNSSPSSSTRARKASPLTCLAGAGAGVARRGQVRPAEGSREAAPSSGGGPAAAARPTPQHPQHRHSLPRSTFRSTLQCPRRGGWWAVRGCLPHHPHTCAEGWADGQVGGWAGGTSAARVSTRWGGHSDSVRGTARGGTAGGRGAAACTLALHPHVDSHETVVLGIRQQGYVFHLCGAWCGRVRGWRWVGGLCRGGCRGHGVRAMPSCTSDSRVRERSGPPQPHPPTMCSEVATSSTRESMLVP